MDVTPTIISPNSSSAEDASVCPDYISSYTQISNLQDLSQHTDVDSSDEFSEIDDLNTKPLDGDETDLPQLSSQIIEWSKERFQTYDNDNEINSFLTKQNVFQKKFSQKGHIDKEKFYFVQMKLLQNIENYANRLSENVNAIMKFISDSSINMTSHSLRSIESFQTSLYDTCESVDSNIKLMYKIIANCEELSKSLGFIETLSLKIRELKQTLELFERII